MENQTSTFFKLPSLPWIVNILGWFYGFVGCSALFPDLVPYQYLGPGGTAMKSILLNYPNFALSVLVSGVSAHIFEAIIGWSLCGKKGIKGTTRFKWFFSTAIFGGTSLYELVNFKPHRSVHAD